jgi:hypothetical protein
MTFFVQMLAHTPPYVFFLLAYLVWQGMLSLRPRQTPVWRMLIVPAAFTVTGLLLLLLRPSGGILPMAAWLGGLGAFVPLGLVSGPRIVGVDRQTGRVMRAGSPVPLLRNLLVFASQYAIAVALVLHPQAQANLTVVGHVVSGSCVGYFLGWTLAFWRRYRAARDVAPTGLSYQRAELEN